MICINRYIEGHTPSQGSFLPECLDDYIDKNNGIRFIDAFVDSLDMKGLGFVHAQCCALGRPCYDPRVLLKLYIYGHMNRIRSSRMLERECSRNIELWWLVERLRPDHNTIADFRKDNRKQLVKVFRLFVTLCVQLELCTGNSVCIDGTPIKAANGMHQATNVKLSQKKLDYAREQLELVEKYLSGLDEADTLDQGRLDKPFALDIDPDNPPDPAKLRETIRKHEAHLQEMKEKGETQLLFTDPEARVMPAKRNGLKACYNIQTATDTDTSLIVGFVTTHACNDMGQLSGAAQEVKAVLGKKTLHTIADKGYESGPDIEKCLMNGIMPDVGFKYDREERVFNLDYIPQAISPERQASEDPKDIRACLHAGVLPKCYENTNLSIEVQYTNDISCFIRHEDGKVTCPMGKELFKIQEKKYGTVYASKEACRTCPNRCTDGKQFKNVQFGKDTHYVPVIMYGTSRYPLQPIPNIAQNTPYHAFGRAPKKPARVMLFIKRDKAKQKKRMQVSEHPFGTIKHYDNAGYYLCKGMEKVSAETALSYLSYDIRRAFTLAGGVQGLLALFFTKNGDIFLKNMEKRGA